MSYTIVASSTASSDQVVISPGSHPMLISAIGGPGGGSFMINNQKIEVDEDDTFNLDRNSLPDCIGEQWFVVFDNISKWSVAWDTPECR